MRHSIQLFSLLMAFFLVEVSVACGPDFPSGYVWRDFGDVLLKMPERKILRRAGLSFRNLDARGCDGVAPKRRVGRVGRDPGSRCGAPDGGIQKAGTDLGLWGDAQDYAQSEGRLCPRP